MERAAVVWRRQARWVLVVIAGAVSTATAERDGSTALPPPASRSGASKPHIVLVAADDLGWNDISWHNSDVLSPHLAALAASGIILTDYHVYKVCSPTRASFMTGRLPNRVGLHNFISHDTPDAISKEYILLPQALKTAGYATHHVGKWHLGFWDWEYIPSNRGFDTSFGYMTGAEDYWTHSNGKGCVGLDLTFCIGKNLTAQPKYNGTYSTYMYEERLHEIVDMHDHTKPLFLYFAPQNVHEPLEAPDTYINLYPSNYANSSASRRTFAAMVTALDDVIGNLTTAMKTADMWSQTLFIFSTDNGGNLGASGNNLPLRGGKFTFWEGGTRGVAFVAGPMVPTQVAGTINRGLSHACDWYATILEIVGIEPSSLPRMTAIDSHSLKKMLFTPSTPSPRTSIVHESTQGATNGTAATGKIRFGDWNLYLGNPGYSGYPEPGSGKGLDPQPDACSKSPCLFNVSASITENPEDDVAAANPAVVAQLLKLLGAAAWNCPDGLCTVDSYTGPATSCDSLKVYGAFGPWAPLGPPPAPPTPPPAPVRFAQGDLCLVHGVPESVNGKPREKLGLLQLGECDSAAAIWQIGEFRSGSEGNVPVIWSADPALLKVTSRPCIHVNHHDSNNTCDGTPTSNRPFVQACAHGNAFFFSDGALRNENCPNWASGSCLAPTQPQTPGSSIITAPCNALAQWDLKH